LIQYIIFWHQEGVQVRSRLIEVLKNPSLNHILRGEITLYEDDQYLLLEIPFLFSNEKSVEVQPKPVDLPGVETAQIPAPVNQELKEGKDDEGWHELAPTEVKLQFESSRTYSQSLINILTMTIPDLTHLQTYYLFAAGSAEDYWFETRIDVDRLKMTEGTKERSLREISSKTRLEILSDHIGGYSKLLANKVSIGKGDSLVLGFGSRARETSLEDYPTSFMYVVTLGGMYSGPDPELMGTETYYEQTVGSFALNFGKFLLYHSKLMALYNIGYMEANVRATEIKTKAQRMQREINSLIRESQKRRREQVSSSAMWYLTDTKDSQREAYDEGLLYNASIYFSHITELLQTVSNAIHLSKENTYFLNRTGSSLGFESIPNPLTVEKTEHASMQDEFKRISDQVTHAFESLKLEIESTQISLRNTVDVLKTFLEGKQRQSSTRSSKTLGLLTIVFACFVFIDMISNYFIFFLESERSYTVVSEVIIAMIVTLWPSLIMFVFLYFIVLKKMWF